MPRQSESKSSSVKPSWQTLRIVLGGLVFAVAGLALSVPRVHAQLYDSLDAYPPRWHLDTSDCDARILTHQHLPDGGIDGRACEVVTLNATHGTEAVLAYPIEPIVPIDGLTANMAVMSARPGARIGFRVRFPYLRPEPSRRPASVIVYGASYNDSGQFATIGIGMIERPLRLKTMALRGEHGSDANLKDPYVDAVVVNAYSGVGVTALRLDELRVDGIVSVSDVSRATLPQPDSRGSDRDQRSGAAAMNREQSGRVDPEGSSTAAVASRNNAFPNGKITRILQHNGEPLAWVRSLGFDAVQLSSPPDALLLNEAIQTRMTIYAPAPSAPDPSLQALLHPVAAWYIGHNEALDSTRVDAADLTARRLRSFPSPWQRPIVGAPSESFRRYMTIMDAMVHDMPIRSRGLTAEEEVAEMAQFSRRVGDRVQTAAGVMSMPPERTLRQTQAIADSIGAPQPTGFRWHSMWLQTMRSLQISPHAILFRSTHSLASGTELDTHRSMALSYVNRVIAMLEPWIAGATPVTPLRVTGAPYYCSRLSKDDVDVVLLTSKASRGSEVLAGDGQTLELILSPTDSKKTIWRLTNFTAQRLAADVTATGARLSIVSPDAAEIIVISSDPSVGGELSQSAARFARQAALDRWQLAGDLVRQTRNQWQTVLASQVGDRNAPMDLIGVAGRTLAEAEPLYRAGDTDATLRMARRADAWALRSEWQLTETLMPDWPRPTSCPPIDCGAAEVQTMWFPLTQERGWSRNFLTAGALDTAESLSEERWKFGKRLEGRAKSEVVFASRGSYAGPGALLARATAIADDPLPGGYEGTVIQIRSPAVRVPANTAVRMDALVRTIGFGRPHQGVLVYDSIGGQEMGLLVRGRSAWTPVRLYRQTTEETDISVMFELMGDGEVMIDEVTLRLWQPEKEPPPKPFRPLNTRPLNTRPFSTQPLNNGPLSTAVVDDAPQAESR
ncbi:hypothetical protein [Novipirellula maiorica]|uniref:hypothetical protein n=1 Tax=Novipirellula maiorica TaxID=1265734 RepID=UPI001F2C256E|nr:hypothetical protein [Rhodopirellula maiorica]